MRHGLGIFKEAFAAENESNLSPGAGRAVRLPVRTRILDNDVPNGLRGGHHLAAREGKAKGGVSQ
jgi:hypothetical protein